MNKTTRLTMRSRAAIATIAVAVVLLAVISPRVAGQAAATGWKVIAWNNLGMHCMDADFSVFAILPPYNTIQAQVIDPNGLLLTTPSGVQLTYQGVADPSGSVTTTSAGRTNFWSYVLPLFGVSLPVDTGLLNHNMPGSANAPQSMIFDPTYKWFIAEGIPITPIDDAGLKQYYPMMKVTAHDASGTALASTSIVLPVSDEMTCRACHSSTSGPAARPAAGWVGLPDPERDYRFNILRLHDQVQAGSATYASALATRGYSASGLEATASGGQAILCANCHASEALAGSGIAGIPQLTTSIHSRHASVVDPSNGLALDSSANRSACYNCHPGSVTRCLRGVMGNAVASDGSLAIQCQSCHGSLGAVGASTRTGWLQEPTCQSCHTGTAVTNNGQIRYVSALDTNGLARVAVDQTFATSANTPAAGYDLYRFSAGHGDLQCSACHGSTHAEYPSSGRNDNLQSVALQGHVGKLGECGSCHATVPTTANGGPHGMHPVGQSWISVHNDAAGSACRACHGTDYRGTVLSRTFGARTLSAFGTKNWFAGQQVGCYSCHNGPGGSGTPPAPAVASNLSLSTSAGTSKSVTLSATGAGGTTLTYRIVNQATGGTVGLAGAVATYFPAAGFSGNDSFTYAAWNGSSDSNLATVTVAVSGNGGGGGGPACTVTTTAAVPASGTVGTAVAFSGSATPSNCSGTVAYSWNFGDGSALSTAQSPTHTYTAAGTYQWTMTATDAGVSSSQTGPISIAAAPPPPPSSLSVSRVTALYNPFRIQIDGANFKSGVRVYIGGSERAWPNLTYVSSSKLVLKGEGLSRLFPVGKPVSLRIVNPDGRSVTTSFTRPAPATSDRSPATIVDR